MIDTPSLPKKVTCGVLVTDGRVFLIGTLVSNYLPTRYWDLPKGVKNDDETPIEGAIRELAEETGIIAKHGDLIDLGRYAYRKEKDAHLFLYYRVPLPPINELHCSTFITIPEAPQPLPEMNTYRYILFREKGQYLGGNIVRVINRIEMDFLAGWIRQK